MMSNALAEDFICAIRDREISRGTTDRNDVNSYTLGYLIGTLSTLMQKYPGISQDIQSYTDYIRSDCQNAG